MKTPSTPNPSMHQVTDEERARYRDDGFFITDVLFDTATLDGVQAEFQRVWDEDIARAERKGNPKEIEHARVRAFSSALERRSAVCAAFCRHPQLVGIAEQMIGGDINLTWNQCIAKPPSKGKAFAWHQDSYYALTGEYSKNVVDRERLIDPRLHLTFWVAITRTTIENGTLWVVPGAHKNGLLPHVWSEEHLEWQCQFDHTKKIAAELRRGQALVFTNLTPHASGANVSNEVRMAYQIGYAVPGMVKNEDQIPMLRGGKRV